MMDYNQLAMISEDIGDCFYIFKENKLASNIDEFKNAFRIYYNNVKLGYSVKTNYTPYVIEQAYKKGTYIEVVSEMELELARLSAVPYSSMIYNGPIKNRLSLEKCLVNHAIVNIDNLQELKLIQEITKNYPDTIFKVGIRINIPLNDGFDSRFGFDINSSDFKCVIEEINQSKNILMVGLHTHSTRPDKSCNSYLKKLNFLFEVYQTYFNKESLEYIDLGGGFLGEMDENIKEQFAISNPTSFEDYGRAIGKKMKDYFPDEKVQLILEPGLALTVNIFDFTCKVLSIRTINDKNIATVSGSFHNVKPSGHNKNLTIERYSNILNQTKHLYTIAGYTCLENDIINRNYLTELNEGDFIVFKNVGAYTIVFKPVFIKLSPAIIILTEKGYRIIKDREEIKDMFKSFKFNL